MIFMRVMRLFCVLLVLKSGFALRCYECTELNNEGCGHHLTAMLEQHECNDTTGYTAMCGKITDFGITARTCVPSNICELIDNGVEHCSVCDTDGCNGLYDNVQESTESTDVESSSLHEITEPTAVQSTTPNSAQCYLFDSHYVAIALGACLAILKK